MLSQACVILLTGGILPEFLPEEFSFLSSFLRGGGTVRRVVWSGECLIRGECLVRGCLVGGGVSGQVRCGGTP